MSQTKTILPQFGRSISKLVSASTLTAGVLAGGISLLNAGGAQAVGTVNCTPTASGVFTMSAVDVTAGNNPDKAPPCQINSVGLMGTAVNQWDAGQIDTSGSFRYSVNAGSLMFTEVSLNTDISFNQLGTVTKNIYSDPGYTNLIGTMMSTNGNSVAFQPLTDQTLSTIYIEDTYSFNGTTQLNSISNNFKVTPGPLPILGAGASFAFSRKLRRRIKSAV